MKEIETGIIHVIFSGDRSVGIFDEHWVFKGESHGAGESPIIFENPETLEEFKKKLAELVGDYITGYPCFSLTNEEYLKT
jgi:hypothetical protein